MGGMFSGRREHTAECPYIYYVWLPLMQRRVLGVNENRCEVNFLCLQSRLEASGVAYEPRYPDWLEKTIGEASKGGTTFTNTLRFLEAEQQTI